MREGKDTIINGFKSAGVTEAIQSAQEIVTKVENSFREQSVRVSGILYRFHLYTREKYTFYFELIMQPSKCTVFLLSFLQSIVFILRYVGFSPSDHYEACFISIIWNRPILQLAVQSLTRTFCSWASCRGSVD